MDSPSASKARGIPLGRLVLLLLLGLPGPAVAQPPDTVWLEELTWTELRDRVRAGTTTVLIPVGGVEQSGPAIALGKHDRRARILAERIARQLGQTVIAPVVAYVPEGSITPPTSHMRFPGTLSLPADVFRKTVEAAALSLAAAGFRDVVLLGEHGSYQGDLAAVDDALNRRWAGTPVRAHFIAAYYQAATTGFAAALRERGFSAAEIGSHAGVADTSLTLALDPHLVRADALPGGADLDAAHGVYGDPRRSSAAVGEVGVALIVERSVAAIRAALKQPRHP